MRRQRGYLMPVAIFIVLVMGTMALTISRYTSQGAAATLQEVMTVQAFYAADSGAQYAMNQLFYNTAQPVTPALALASCDAMAQPNPAEVVTYSGAGLHDCSATIRCTSNNVSGVLYVEIDSVGECGDNTPFRAQRSVGVSAFIQ